VQNSDKTEQKDINPGYSQGEKPPFLAA